MRCSGLPALGPQTSTLNPWRCISEACLEQENEFHRTTGRCSRAKWQIYGCPSSRVCERSCNPLAPVRPKTEVESKGRFHLYMNM